jgi:3-oxoacyl-[acyl-carrier protein] reductase
MDDLTGKIAIVTGASRGLGRAIAAALAEAGCDVAVNYRERKAEAMEAAAEIRRIGRRAAIVRADVSTAAGVATLARATAEVLGPASILVNNAGVAVPRELEDLTEDDWDFVLKTNLTSAFLMTQAVLPPMREQRWGRIITIASVAAQLGGVVGPHYAASKAGLLGLTHSYAALLAREGITVNAICPALIDTDMVASNPRAVPDALPVGRFGVPDEVAEVAVMLARNGFMTGQTVSVNGGWYMT